jgi:hypothetical protein
MPPGLDHQRLRPSLPSRLPTPPPEHLCRSLPLHVLPPADERLARTKPNAQRDPTERIPRISVHTVVQQLRFPAQEWPAGASITTQHCSGARVCGAVFAWTA